MPPLKRAFEERVGRDALATTRKPRRSSATWISQERVVNDVHSQLNQTRVRRIIAPASLESLQALVRKARAGRETIAIAGGRHAMGGQQFGEGAVLLDMARMNRVLSFEPERSEVEVEAGIEWPALIEYLIRAQSGSSRQVGIIQKQTGADRLSIGGALAANMHGRGLRFKPIIGDVESFVLVDAEGVVRTCSRLENAELFRLAIGGYGLFGIIASVRLRLAPRRKLERVVRVVQSQDLSSLFEKRVASGFLYGDFQFATARDNEEFLRTGIFSCYRPVEDTAMVTEGGKELSAEDWRELLYLAHVDRQRAFELYASHYLSTSGQIYWSDTHQLSVYLDDYHRDLDRRLGAVTAERGSEMITEVYVPRARLAEFMERVREDFRLNSTELIYGTVRLIEKDDESFLAWARNSWACVVFNLHVTHSQAGIEKAKGEFRRLIDRAIQFDGSYYLTYHRWADCSQVTACYPQFPEFLRLKKKYDGDELFQSDWYRHYRAMFAEGRD